jgi:thioredoxin reductase (NADPH)
LRAAGCDKSPESDGIRGNRLLAGPDLLTDGKPPAAWPLGRHPFYLKRASPARSLRATCGTAAVGEGAMAVQFVHRRLAGARSGP